MSKINLEDRSKIIKKFIRESREYFINFKSNVTQLARYYKYIQFLQLLSKTNKLEKNQCNYNLMFEETYILKKNKVKQYGIPKFLELVNELDCEFNKIRYKDMDKNIRIDVDMVLRQLKKIENDIKKEI